MDEAIPNGILNMKSVSCMFLANGVKNKHSPTGIAFNAVTNRKLNLFKI